MRKKSNLITKEAGASLVEYALLVALIAMVAIFSIRNLGGSTQGHFKTVSGLVDSAGKKEP